MAQDFNYISGPAGKGDYAVGETITFMEDGRILSGEVLHCAAAGPSLTGKHQPLNYKVDCDDGFPHIVWSSQIVQVQDS